MGQFFSLETVKDAWMWESDHLWLQILKVVFGVIVLGLLLIGTFDRVKWYERAVKVRMGAFVPYRRGPLKGRAKEFGPGLRMMIPGADRMIKVDMREATLPIAPKVIKRKIGHDNLSSNIVLKATKDWIARFIEKHSDINTHMVALAQKYLEEMIREGVDETDLRDEMLKRIQPVADKYGVTVVDYLIGPINPTEATQQAIALSDTGIQIRFGHFNLRQNLAKLFGTNA